MNILEAIQTGEKSDLDSSFGIRLLAKARMPDLPHSRYAPAFSLIEVVFALAVFSFSMLTIVGLMATGLSSASDSSRNTAMANIQRLVRANVSATTYASITNTASPGYFTTAGYPTVQTSTVDSPYYSVSYTTNLPSGSVVSTGSATIVRVSIGYPYPSNTRTNTFSLYVAP